MSLPLTLVCASISSAQLTPSTLTYGITVTLVRLSLAASNASVTMTSSGYMSLEPSVLVMFVKLAVLIFTPPLPGGSMARVLELPIDGVSHFLRSRSSKPNLYVNGRSSSIQYMALSTKRVSIATPTGGSTASDPLYGRMFIVKIES